jgi:hypothetical protein
MIRNKEKYFDSNISSVKLYLDDIEKIIHILRSENAIIKITDEENTYDSIDEIKTIKGINPKLINIEGKLQDVFFEYIYIRLTKNSLIVTVYNSEKLLKAAYEIERFVKTKKRPIIYSFFNSRNSKVNIVLNIILSFGFYITNALIYQKDYSFKIWLYIIIFWSIILLLSELNPNSNTKIELKRRYESNFWEVNKDRILLIIITATITTIITILIK